MRSLIVALFLLSACGGEEPETTGTTVPTEPKVSTPDPYCGDGVCDERLGEDEWWCIDCGYDWLIGGPKGGGYCGDGMCFGNETTQSCCRDCCPIPILPWNGKYNPGWIDPISFAKTGHFVK